MKSFAYSSVLLTTVAATACATSPADPNASGGGKADGDSASLTFNSDFSESQSGPLLAGDSVRISYALDRITDCRTESGGSDQFGITGYAQFDAGAPVAFAVSRLSSGKAVPIDADVSIPASATHVALWFQIADTFGCTAYDSNDNANYTYSIDHGALGAVLSFEAQGDPSQSAALHAGDKVVLHYAPERLAACAGSTGGHAAYAITGYWQIDGGATHQLSVMSSAGDALDPTIALPHGSDLAVWFDSSNIWGCHAYDSANGANYHFAID